MTEYCNLTSLIYKNKGNEMFNYCVLGGGRQGTSIAYDLLKFGNPQEVIIADIDFEKATESANRNTKLLKSSNVRAVQVNVNKKKQML